MAWSSWTLGTQTTVRLGVFEFSSLQGIRLEPDNFPSVATLLNSPFTTGSLEIDSDNRLSAVGSTASAPDSPMLPGWRKVVRVIG